MAESVFAIAGVVFLAFGLLNRKVKFLRVDKFELALVSLTQLERFGLIALGFVFVCIASLPILEINVPAILSARATETSRSSQIVPCEETNLLTCSDAIPVFVPEQSTVTVEAIANELDVTFDNRPGNTTGCALQFEPPLDVTGYRYLEVRGKTAQSFDLAIEYKAQQNDVLETVKSSQALVFPYSLGISAIRVDIVYSGPIQELVITFPTAGQSGQVVVSSIRLVR